MTQTTTFLTVVTPIADSQTLEKAFRKQRWSQIAASLRKHCHILHSCRFHVINALYPGRGDGESDELDQPLLLFTAEIDWTPADLFDRLYGLDANGRVSRFGGSGELVREIWGHCVGYPFDGGETAFRRYMLSNSIKPGFTLGGHVSSTVTDITRSVALMQVLMMEFEGGATQDAPLPGPGSFVFVKAIDELMAEGPDMPRRILDAMEDGSDPRDFVTDRDLAGDEWTPDDDLE